LWDGPSGAPLATLAGHTGGVRGAQLLPDGRILSWSWDRTLRLWDERSGALLTTLTGHTSEDINAQISPDGRILTWCDSVSYVGPVDHTPRLWDGKNGIPLATLAGHTGWVEGVQFLPDGRILTWSLDKTLRLWDGNSGAPLATFSGHTNGVTGAQLLPNGRILSWAWDKTLRLWDDASGKPISEPIAEKDLPWVDPCLLYQRNASRSPAGNSEQTACWSLDDTGGIATWNGSISPVCWQGNSQVDARELLSDGILVVTVASGHVFYLHLYRGAQRISIQEYEAGS